MSKVLVHAGYLFCNRHSLNVNYYINYLQWNVRIFEFLNVCVVEMGMLGPQFIVSSERLLLHKLLPPRGLEQSTSRMPSKRHATGPLIVF